MNEKPEDFSPEEKLRNETEILKLKLEVENGAIIHMSDELKLPAQLENEWFNHIYNYEKLCKEAGYTTVYDFIEKPEIKDLEDIPSEKWKETLDELLEYMYGKGINLCYDEETNAPETIYKFINEELFKEEVCRYRGPGGKGHAMFCYEEFHPNHDKDLFRYTKEFLEQLVGEKECLSEFFKFTHEDQIELNKKTLSLEKYSESILRFKEQYPIFLFFESEIGKISFDMETANASVTGTILMLNKIVPYVIYFKFSYGLWAISGLELNLIDEGE